MSRIWNFSRSEGQGGTDLLPARTPDRHSMPPGARPGPEWHPDDDAGSGDAHYVTRPVRPVSQLAVRIALWGAVGLGALGGIVAMVRTASAEDPEALRPEVDEEVGVPAPVAGTAELVVQEWLTASDGEDAALAALFVSPPPLDRSETGTLEVLDTKAVAGLRLEKGYWSVTVAARVFETPRSVSEDEPLPEAPEATTWYVELGIVGEVGDALKALTTPAIVPPPTMDEASPWLPSAQPTQTVGSDDRIAATVEDFLNALLAGRGDPGRYLAHDVVIPAVTPPPFVSVEVLEMSGITLDEDDEADVRLWVLARLATAGGAHHVVGYEIRAVENIDRWEIVSIWGAPDVQPSSEDDSGTPPTSAGIPVETTAPESGEDTGEDTEEPSGGTTSTVDMSGETGSDGDGSPAEATSPPG